MYLISANEFSFQVDAAELANADIISTSATTFHVISDVRSMHASLIEAYPSGKKFIIEVEGEKFEVEIRDELDQMLDKMGFGTVTGKQIKEIKAPMPGLVLQVSVENGQEVRDGDKILILEAMKMENSILIHSDAVIKKVIVSPGQAVEKGQVLVELE
jgi:biotin carboxyl carrier protein